MEQFLQALINGVMLGGFYAVMVLGFSVIWGVMGVINLAHGTFLMIGGYIAWYFQTNFGWDPFLSVFAIMPIMFVFGYIIQIGLINRIIERPHLVALLVTFGLEIILSNVVKNTFSADPRLTSSFFSGAISITDNLTIPRAKGMILIFALVIMVALYLFLQHTKLGKSIRAAAQNKEAARIVGIEINMIYAMTFAICIGLTGVAGGLISPTQAIFPFMGVPFTIKAFAITAMSGLGSIPGALLGGMFLGLIEVIVATYVPGIGTNLGIVTSFVLLVLVLVTRPQGLFGGLSPAGAH
ncbi:MAG: branched-chain amino acid transport system permease protein [Cellvibrionaceae bacterium]|jgi:branched-chain amino acid transport system permease protein